MQPKLFAHSLPDQPTSSWELLSHHLEAVSTRAAGFAQAFGFAGFAEAAGRLHDIGKASAAFQRYIGAQGAADEPGPRRVDHSTAGAREVLKRYQHPIGRMLSVAIAGHHAGLADGTDLDRRLDPGQTAIEPYAGWEAHAGTLPGRLAARSDFKNGSTRASVSRS